MGPKIQPIGRNFPKIFQEDAFPRQKNLRGPSGYPWLPGPHPVGGAQKENGTYADYSPGGSRDPNHPGVRITHSEHPSLSSPGSSRPTTIWGGGSAAYTGWRERWALRGPIGSLASRRAAPLAASGRHSGPGRRQSRAKDSTVGVGGGGRSRHGERDSGGAGRVVCGHTSGGVKGGDATRGGHQKKCWCPKSIGDGENQQRKRGKGSDAIKKQQRKDQWEATGQCHASKKYKPNTMDLSPPFLFGLDDRDKAGICCSSSLKAKSLLKLTQIICGCKMLCPNWTTYPKKSVELQWVECNTTSDTFDSICHNTNPPPPPVGRWTTSEAKKITVLFK